VTEALATIPHQTARRRRAHTNSPGTAADAPESSDILSGVGECLRRGQAGGLLARVGPRQTLVGAVRSQRRTKTGAKYRGGDAFPARTFFFFFFFLSVHRCTAAGRQAGVGDDWLWEVGGGVEERKGAL